MAKADAIESFDFEKEFKLKADVAAKLKAAAGAAAEMSALSQKIDADLKLACGNLAHDLGGAGDYKDAQEACKAANAAIADIKGKLGPKVKIAVDIVEPHCGVDINAYADCAGHCDVSAKGGKVEVKCEKGKLQGQCSGKCQGECTVEAGASCSGECRGTCDSEIKGECSGKCSGKCDGKAIPGAANGRCDGVCDGKCDAEVKAECKGSCGGTCKAKAEAECKGTCTGSCSVEMQAPKCIGTVDPPQVSAECKAKCDGGVQAKAECTPAYVHIRISGSADAKAEAMFRQAIEKDLGPVLKVAVGVGKGAAQLAGDIKVVLEGVQATVQAYGDPLTVGRLTACIAAPFKGALDAAAHVQANISVSVSVQASASAKSG
jgi:activator of HSP90 ATPase